MWETEPKWANLLSLAFAISPEKPIRPPDVICTPKRSNIKSCQNSGKLVVYLILGNRLYTKQRKPLTQPDLTPP